MSVDPVSFHDSLVIRARNLRFRGAGSPYDFLSDIGIVPIKEFIYKGSMLIDVAETLNVSVTQLKNWIANEGLESEIEEASISSAEGYIANGERLLKSAENKFQLDKAKAMIEHGRFMASKKDKKTYGNQLEITGGPAQVHYVFAVPATSQVMLDAQAPKQLAIDAEFNEVPPVRLDPLNLGSALPARATASVESGVTAVEVQDA
jgi:hypothetical protein